MITLKTYTGLYFEFSKLYHSTIHIHTCKIQDTYRLDHNDRVERLMIRGNDDDENEKH